MGPCVFAEDCAGFSDACTVGTCVNGVCQKLPANDGTACDDGIGCTLNDACQAGECTGTSTKFCPSSNTCSIGFCDPVTDSCTEVPGNDGATCNDQNPCTQAGTCAAGACNPGPQVDCSFLDSECGVGMCDPNLGCVAMPLAEGAACNDGLFCTVQDKCAMGICSGVPNLCDGDGSGCFVGACDEAQNKCITVPGNNGGACDDGNACTSGETCSNGNCIGGVPANQGMMCDDQNGCTGGTTCSNGVCTNATSQVVACVNGDQCCPMGCAANGDSDCLYWASGVLQNVAPADLTGWTECYSDTYAEGSTPMSSILQACSKGKLLLACRPVNSPTYTLAAMAPRADVTYDCGTQNACVHQANGVGWYWSDQWSWGFAPGGLPVSRNSCDVESALPEQRLCWHSGGGNINQGYRCGSNSLNGDASWERVVFHAD
jgi:hypothetical protein